LALAIGLFPSSAAAITSGSVTCPATLVAGQTNQYTVNPAIDCVFDNGTKSDNIGQGGGNDGFLNGGGTNIATPYDSVLTAGSTFGRTWDVVSGGLLLTNVTNTFANFQVTDTTYGLYALGVKDGSAPFWAVFLLDPNKLSGTVSMTGGSFSHFVLYGFGTPTNCPDCGITPVDVNAVPEPASLVLLSSGLAFAARKLRKRRSNAAATV